MDLKDFLREKTREPVSSIASLRETIARLGQDSETNEKLAARARAAADELASRRAQDQARADKLAAEVLAVQGQIKELQDRSALLQREQEDLFSQVTQSDQQLTDARKEFRRTSEEVEKRLKDLDQRRADLSVQEKRLKDGRVKALASYLEQEWGQLLSLSMSRDQARNGWQAYNSLRLARDADPVVATLCEERDELGGMLRNAVVPGVQARLRTEVGRLEAELDRRFPGAMQYEVLREKMLLTEHLSEIYSCRLREGDGPGLRLFLPIPLAVGRCLDDGQKGHAEGLAVQLVLAFGKFFAAQKATIVPLPTLGVPALDLITFDEGALRKAEQAEGLDVALPGEGKASFWVSELPLEIKEALDADPNP